MSHGLAEFLLHSIVFTLWLAAMISIAATAYLWDWQT